MNIEKPNVPSENNDVIDEPETRLEWQKPVLEVLDFRNTQGGAGSFGEGTFGGFPVGSLTS